MSVSSTWRLSIGAQPEAGGVHFRVWAPTARTVDVILYEGDKELSSEPLELEEKGYFSGVVRAAGPGSRYRYRLDGGEAYPDPASRSQPEGVHGPSEVIDPDSYSWAAPDGPTLSPEDLVIYELHFGTFTDEGTFDAAIGKLDALRDLGVTALEPLPVATFPGTRNWGYDGVNLFAPSAVYGGPEGLKRFVDAAHSRGLAVILDVVYNHFGPEGNYIPAVTGGRFFTERHETPWGAGINYDDLDSGPVRDFVLQNALHWLLEYNVDGLRLDATHAILDESPKHLLAELTERVSELPGRKRFIIAEDDRNEPTLLLPPDEGGFGLDGVWSDDLHHQLRRLSAGDSEGYFERYSGTTDDVAITLAHGWWRNREQAPALPPTGFIHCIQNHDQVGNRALGERLNHQIPAGTYRALSTLLLTSPYTPLIWMGQEWGASSPFLYFTDHPEELGRLVTEGRRSEFSHFSAFSDPATAATIPDPQAVATFAASKLDWSERDEALHAGILALYQELLGLRRSEPALRNISRDSFGVEAVSEGAIALRRLAPEGASLLVVLNFRGEVMLDLRERELTRSRDGWAWSYLLSTEELRFGGDGAWGRLEADGILHLVEPAGVILSESVAALPAESTHP